MDFVLTSDELAVRQSAFAWIFTGLFTALATMLLLYGPRRTKQIFSVIPLELRTRSLAIAILTRDKIKKIAPNANLEGVPRLLPAAFLANEIMVFVNKRENVVIPYSLCSGWRFLDGGVLDVYNPAPWLFTRRGGPLEFVCNGERLVIPQLRKWSGDGEISEPFYPKDEARFHRLLNPSAD